MALALGLWIDRQQPASRVIAIAAMAGILASLVDLFVLKQHGDTDFVHQLGVHLAEWEWKRM